MNDTLLIVMTVFVIVAAIAMVAQAAAMWGVYKATRSAQERILTVMPKVESLLATSQQTIEQSRVQILELTTKTNQILDTTKVQLARVDSLMADASGRAKAQLEKAEIVIDDTLSRAHQTVNMVHGGIVRPVREVQAVAAGLKTALQHFLRGGRPSPAQATADEEMFI
jgi:isoleucyl-tRNA synthetase